jgi:hypothetical protein
MIEKKIHHHSAIETVTGRKPLPALAEQRVLLRKGIDPPVQHDTVPERMRKFSIHPPLHEIAHEIAYQYLRVISGKIEMDQKVHITPDNFSAAFSGITASGLSTGWQNRQSGVAGLHRVQAWTAV